MGNARQAHIHHEGADPLGSLFRGGFGIDDGIFSHWREGNKTLTAIQNVAVAVLYRFDREAARVAARIGFS